MSNKHNSPYSAAITGGGFLFEETNNILPLLMHPDGKEMIKEEIVKNEILKMNTERTRKLAVTEIVRRYNAMPVSFWNDYKEMSDDDKQIALFFVILKTYKICFDFHVNVTMRKWNSISKQVSHEDIMMEFNEISANDAFVDSWSESTKKNVASAYLTILRKVGILSAKGSLSSASCSNFGYYLEIGEPWFLDACLLYPYQIDNIKKSLL